MNYEDDRNLEDFFDDDEYDEQPNDYVGVAYLALLNQQYALNTAINIASKDLLWRWRSQDYRLKKITNAYKYLNKLIESQE
jgi:hypothetical protein